MALSRKEILEKAKWNKDTGYPDQLTYVFDDGFQISVPRSKEGMTRWEVEETLVDEVNEYLRTRG